MCQRDIVFELVFGHIPAVVPPVVVAPVEREAEETALVALNEDEDIDFGVHMTRRDSDDNIDNEIYDTNEGDIRFDSPD